MPIDGGAPVATAPYKAVLQVSIMQNVGARRALFAIKILKFPTFPTFPTFPLFPKSFTLPHVPIYPHHLQQPNKPA